MTRKKICVITGTRAEYGLLYWVMKGIQAEPAFELQLCVTGMHLSPEFGLTYRNIENDGFVISKKIECLLSSDTPVGISKSIALAVAGFAEAFHELNPDLIVLLGDRFEILAAATAAVIAKIPIAHCHGGESTEGLIDEPIRHAVTKMSHLHFTSTEWYRQRVIQLGEQPENVYNVGALGIENINKLQLLSKEDFERSIDFRLAEKSILVTFHPVTLEHATAEYQFGQLLKVLEELRSATIIFTKPNADTDGRIIIKMIDEFVSTNPNSISFISMGQTRYLSALKYVDVVIGNSSSGLIEVPSFKKPTINIGDRQRGRIMADSVVSCDPTYDGVRSALQRVMSEAFQAKLQQVTNPYGNGNSSEKIIDVIRQSQPQDLIKKTFHDL